MTEQLQAERNIGRKLNARLNNVEMEMDNLKEKLREKETFLIELEKEKLQTAQIADQMQHYQAQSHHAHTLQQELQNALVILELFNNLFIIFLHKYVNPWFYFYIIILFNNCNYILQSYIENLKKENEELTKKLENKIQEETHLSTKDININGDQYITKNEQNCNDVTIMQNLSLPEDKNISDYNGPITKLEKRFKETMEKVAELTDEKQKLEHLVLQLQSETETIGILYYF